MTTTYTGTSSHTPAHSHPKTSTTLHHGTNQQAASANSITQFSTQYNCTPKTTCNSCRSESFRSAVFRQLAIASAFSFADHLLNVIFEITHDLRHRVVGHHSQGFHHLQSSEHLHHTRHRSHSIRWFELRDFHHGSPVLTRSASAAFTYHNHQVGGARTSPVLLYPSAPRPKILGLLRR